MRTLVVLAALSFVLAAPLQAAAEAPKGPPVMPYKHGAPVPLGYHVGSVGSPGLVGGGLFSFGLPYSLGAVAIGFDGNGALPLLFPVIGPLIAAITHGSTNADKKGIDAVSALYLVDGAAQIAGVTMIILGVSLKQDVLFRSDVYPPGKEPAVIMRAIPRVNIGPGFMSLSVQF